MKHTMKGRMVKESYEVSDELADRLNSILADEFLAAEFYRLAELAMKGNKQHRLSEIADENGEDELEDHFKNLSEWMQSKGIRVVTNHDEMLDITNGSVFTVEDGDSTKDIVDKLIQSEEEAIEAYENLIPDTDLDLRVMLCGFLKDEREHLKALQDAKDEMGGEDYDDDFEDYEYDDEDYDDEEDEEVAVNDDDDEDDEDGEDKEDDASDSNITVTANESSTDFKPGDKVVVVGKRSYKHRGMQGQVAEVNGTCGGEPAVVVVLQGKRSQSVQFFPASELMKVQESSKRGKSKVGESRYEGYPYKVSHIEWDIDNPEDLDDLPKTVIVDVPEEVVAADEEEDYISDWLSDEYGFCHNGFLFKGV